MTHKTVPVEPTEKQKRITLAALLRSSYALNREDREYIARLIEASPPSPVTELETMLADACATMAEWEDREKDHSIDFCARMELCNLAFEKARTALAAFNAKKGAV